VCIERYGVYISSHHRKKWGSEDISENKHAGIHPKAFTTTEDGDKIPSAQTLLPPDYKISTINPRNFKD